LQKSALRQLDANTAESLQWMQRTNCGAKISQVGERVGTERSAGVKHRRATQVFAAERGQPFAVASIAESGYAIRMTGAGKNAGGNLAASAPRAYRTDGAARCGRAASHDSLNGPSALPQPMAERAPTRPAPTMEIPYSSLC